MNIRPPIESIQYLLDVFIEGGYTENDEDIRHIDQIYEWLQYIGEVKLPFSP